MVHHQNITLVHSAYQHDSPVQVHARNYKISFDIFMDFFTELVCFSRYTGIVVMYIS